MCVGGGGGTGQGVHFVCNRNLRFVEVDSFLVEHRIRDPKLASSNPGRSGGRIFFFRISFVC